MTATAQISFSKIPTAEDIVNSVTFAHAESPPRLEQEFAEADDSSSNTPFSHSMSGPIIDSNSSSQNKASRTPPARTSKDLAAVKMMLSNRNDEEFNASVSQAIGDALAQAGTIDVTKGIYYL